MLLKTTKIKERAKSVSDKTLNKKYAIQVYESKRWNPWQYSVLHILRIFFLCALSNDIVLYKCNI